MKTAKLQGFPPCGFRELQTLSLDISLSSSTVLVNCLLSRTDLKKQPWDLGGQGCGGGLEILLLGGSRFRQSLRIFICHLHRSEISLWPRDILQSKREEPDLFFVMLTVPLFQCVRKSCPHAPNQKKEFSSNLDACFHLLLPSHTTHPTDSLSPRGKQ